MRVVTHPKVCSIAARTHRVVCPHSRAQPVCVAVLTSFRWLHQVNHEVDYKNLCTQLQTELDKRLLTELDKDDMRLLQNRLDLAEERVRFLPLLQS